MHTSFVLQSDGAGAYAGVSLLSRLGYLSITIGMKIISHFTGESGGGKSSVDQIFGICKEELKRRVAKGQGDLDISDPITLANALNYRAIKKTISYAVTFSRDGVQDPILNRTAKEAKLQSHSTRHYQYNDEGLPDEVFIEEQSFLPIAGPQKSVTVRGMWPTSQFPFEDIVPKPVMLTSEVTEDSIRAASSLYISKVEKDLCISTRREDNEVKTFAVMEEKHNRNQVWIKKAEDDARRCGLSTYVLCSSAGCRRQFSSQARMAQHLLCGTHQSNGNALSQSSNPMAPTVHNKQTIREMALDSMMQRITNVDLAVHVVGNAVVSEVVPRLQRFGSFRRITLRHPGLNPAVVELLTWLFDRGNVKGGNKCSAGAMLSVAKIYGTESAYFVRDSFWDAAIQRSSGTRIFTDAELPEEWQVKQFISQLSTIVKSKAKALAGVQMLSPERKLSQLSTFLTEIPGLPGDIAVLSATILGLGIELCHIKQKDLNVKLKEHGIFTMAMKRSIVQACKRVGKNIPDDTRTNSPLPVVGDVIEEDLGEPDESLLLLQDQYDAERNDCDSDVEDCND